jgi:hypothetical protein
VASRPIQSARSSSIWPISVCDCSTAIAEARMTVCNDALTDALASAEEAGAVWC